jgi:hypothetical protein
MHLFMLLDTDIALGKALPPGDSPTFIETYLEMEKLLISGLRIDYNINLHISESDTLGKVRSIGISNFSIKTLDILLPQINILPVINQVELHPCLPQEHLLAYCTEKGILLGILVDFISALIELNFHHHRGLLSTWSIQFAITQGSDHPLSCREEQLLSSSSPIILGSSTWHCSHSEKFQPGKNEG